MPDVRAATDADRATLRARFTATWGSPLVVAHGTLFDLLALPAFLAVHAGAVVGSAVYQVSGDQAELLSLEADPRRTGSGTVLVDAVSRTARARGCRVLRVTTTNDNVDALRFYQRRGCRLVELRAGAVDAARRTLKPRIPLVGEHGIALRDELELELALG